MRWLRSWSQSHKVWKRLSVRFLFMFVFLNVTDLILDLLLPPHRLQWRIGHFLVLSLIYSVVSECFLSGMPQSKSPSDPESSAESSARTSRRISRDPR